MIALHLKALSTRHYGRVILSSKYNKVTCDLQVRSLHQIKDRQVEEIRIPVPWGHIAGKWWGPRDRQPILALHGWLDNAATFDPLLSNLPENLSVLALDLPGHGFSSHYPPGQLFHFTEDIATLRRIINSYGWKNITILGHSLGSNYALIYASIYPNEVSKIIGFDQLRPFAVDTKHFIQTGGTDIDKCIDLFLNKTEAPEYALNEITEHRFLASKQSITRKGCEILLTRGCIPSEKSKDRYCLSRDLRLKIWFFHSFPHDCLMELSSRIKCEVLNIKFKQGFDYENPKYYKDTLNILKRCAKRLEYREVDGTHHEHLNDPNSVTQIVKEFLNIV